MIFFSALVWVAACSVNEPATVTPADLLRLAGQLDFVRWDGSTAASIQIEIADTPKARSKGLMERTSLEMTNGMLFIFEREALQQFWMYNTPISLDMIFVDAKRHIIHMSESTQPMSTQIYSSRKPAQYVVEVPAGFVKYFDIREGMHIRWRRW